MGSLLTLFIFGLLVWFWFDSLKVREQAIQIARASCAKHNAQFLDQSVSLESIKPKRDPYGRMTWERIYGFDFSLQGVERRRGRTIMLGKTLKQIQMDIDDGTVIDVVN